MQTTLLLALLLSLRLASCHIALWHPSTWGFDQTKFNPDPNAYDNRAVTPLRYRTFKNWWFHGFLGTTPEPKAVFELPAGQTVTTELACKRGATSYWEGQGADEQDPHNPNYPCPGWPTTQFHTNGRDDVKGCALAIAYKDDVSEVTPEDFTVFSVNQVCVWDRYTHFPVPEKMPPCPNGKCICAWFWIHAANSGTEQMYMIGFKCNVTGSTSTVELAKPKVARRCGADPENGKKEAVPGNCTYGAKQPLYWLQAERNNMHEGPYSPPFYNDLYNFKDGAQNDIFQDSYVEIPEPGPNQTKLPVVAGSTSTSSTVSLHDATTSTPSATTKPINVELPSTTPTPSSTNPVKVTASAEPSDPQPSHCMDERSTSAFSRRHVERGSTSLEHNTSGKTRHNRWLNSRRKSDPSEPF